jgi:CheY-like chemotaxis protein
MLAPETAPRRVLVVDDEPVMRELIGAILDSSSLPYDEAVDGVAALQRLSTTVYAAVILDLMMPVMDGFSVLRALAFRNASLLPRVIVLSAATTDLLDRVDNRVFVVLPKPFATGELRTMVKRCLEIAE